MTRTELWTHITTRNPGLLTGKALTPRGLRQLFDLVWDEARRDLQATGELGVPDFLAGLFRPKPPRPG